MKDSLAIILLTLTLRLIYMYFLWFSAKVPHSYSRSDFLKLYNGRLISMIIISNN